MVAAQGLDVLGDLGEFLLDIWDGGNTGICPTGARACLVT